MTSQTSINQEPVERDSLAISPLQQQIEIAIGGQFGTFGSGSPALPRTCVETCLRSKCPGSLEGTCSLVHALAAGDEPPPDETPSICDQGHAVSVHHGSMSQSRFLVLYPRAVVDEPDQAAPTQTRLKAAGQAMEQCDRLTEENRGLADELLRSFEQLNVIFDITKDIGAHQDVAQVKLVLIRKLATALNSEWGCCVSDREGILWWAADGQQNHGKTVHNLVQSYQEILKDVSENQTIRVKDHSDQAGTAHGYCLMFGPLERDAEDNAEVVVFGRGPDQPGFKSNDMMMLDSVLGHGGHVISNLRLVERLKTMSFEAVRALVSAIDKKDQYTCGHSERVGLISRLIGKEMGLCPEDQQDLEWAGLLHDVGKIGISDRILNKSGKLTDEEFDIIKQHPKMSYEVILPISSFSSVHPGVLYHHEVPDGTGYPEGLKGDAIPLMARIVHVADTFDALTSTRSYRSKFSLQDALGIMRKDTGTKLDSEIMPVFETAIKRFRAEQPGRFSVIFRHLEEQDD